MEEFSRSFDEQIRRAIAEGQFDDLPGKGKPLELSQNPHEDPAWGMAYRILKSSGHTLPWIETRQGIEKDLEAARKSLARTWKWRCSAVEEKQPFQLVEDEWQRLVAVFTEKVAELNQRIFDYNLEVPSSQFKRLKIDLAREIERITAKAD